MTTHWNHFRRWLWSDRRCLTWRIGLLAAKNFLKDDGPTWAAAIAYYSLLSVFPLFLAAGSIAAYFVDPQWAVLQATALLGDFLPKGQAEIERIVQTTLEAGRSGGLLFIVPLLWTGTLAFSTITKALNIVFEVPERYTFFKRLLARLVMLLTLGAVFLLALSASPLLRMLKFTLGILPWGGELIIQIIIGIVPATLVLLAFLLSYRFVPAQRPGWRAALLGAIVAAIFFLAAKPLFFAYIQTLARQNLVYGSLAGMVAAVIWAWMVGMIGLFGAQICALCQAVLYDRVPIEQIISRKKAYAGTTGRGN